MKIKNLWTTIAKSLLFFYCAFLDVEGLSAKVSTTDPLTVKLRPIASGFTNITDIQFAPKRSAEAVILEKTGAAFLLDTRTGQKKSMLLKVDVASESELGLLGFAFHPKFPQVKKVFVHYNPRQNLSRVSEWVWQENGQAKRPTTLENERVILEVEQPYRNHNGGSLVFGPDGFLYVGLGDGGSRGDPGDRAQNLNTLLGKMLRIDVDHYDKNLGYAIPQDNPFASASNTPAGVRREIFAWGLRNPWKYSFDDQGRLIAGDVGQDTWEEITFVPKGANLGWRLFEASHCYMPAKNCQGLAKNTLMPIAEYDRSLGASVTGGYQYGGQLIPALRGRYVFGDFVSGRIWSISLPAKESPKVLTAKDFQTHGKFEISISTFAKDSAGELYTADFAGGTIFQLTPER